MNNLIKIEGMAGEYLRCQLKNKYLVAWKPSWRGAKNKMVNNICSVCGGAARKGVKRHPKCRSKRRDGIKRVIPRSKSASPW